MYWQTILLITPTDYCVGVLAWSQCHDPAEVSGTFWNLSLIYKICSSLYVLIGLQRNILSSKSNQCATLFLWHIGGRDCNILTLVTKKLRDLHYDHSSHSFNKLIKFNLIVSWFSTYWYSKTEIHIDFSWSISLVFTALYFEFSASTLHPLLLPKWCSSIQLLQHLFCSSC